MPVHDVWPSDPLEILKLYKYKRNKSWLTLSDLIGFSLDFPDF